MTAYGDRREGLQLSSSIPYSRTCYTCSPGIQGISSYPRHEIDDTGAWLTRGRSSQPIGRPEVREQESKGGLPLPLNRITLLTTLSVDIHEASLTASMHSEAMAGDGKTTFKSARPRDECPHGRLSFGLQSYSFLFNAQLGRML
jgi:hypothetical protein